MWETSETNVSVIIPTYNRCAALRSAVNSALNQDGLNPLEVLVVDNNSQDNTREVVHSMMEQYPGKVRYLVERNQGNAYARNKGIQAAKGEIIAFIDDDVTVDSDWLRSLKKVLDERRDLSFVGGRVLPQWNEPPPSWLTRQHWSPLALLDYGPSELPISRDNSRGLITANIAFRRTVFEEAGMFSPRLQRVKNVIGSMEDHEFLLRVCRSGKHGLYVPSMIARAPLEVERLTKNYHRRWHTGHGHFYALLRDPEWERSSFRVMGVPAHLLKQTAANAIIWFSRVITGNADAAFAHECHLMFFRGFFKERLRQGQAD